MYASGHWNFCACGLWPLSKLAVLPVCIGVVVVCQLLNLAEMSISCIYMAHTFRVALADT